MGLRPITLGMEQLTMACNFIISCMKLANYNKKIQQ